MFIVDKISLSPAGCRLQAPDWSASPGPAKYDWDCWLVPERYPALLECWKVDQGGPERSPGKKLSLWLTEGCVRVVAASTGDDL